MDKLNRGLDYIFSQTSISLGITFMLTLFVQKFVDSLVKELVINGVIKSIMDENNLSTKKIKWLGVPVGAFIENLLTLTILIILTSIVYVAIF